jgi:hypothetical protein
MHSLNIISVNMQCTINDWEYASSINSEVSGARSKFREKGNIIRSNKNSSVDMVARK